MRRFILSLIAGAAIGSGLTSMLPAADAPRDLALNAPVVQQVAWRRPYRVWRRAYRPYYGGGYYRYRPYYWGGYYGRPYYGYRYLPWGGYWY